MELRVVHGHVTRPQRNVDLAIPILNDEYKVYAVIGDAKWCNRKLREHRYCDSCATVDFDNNRGQTFHTPNLNPVICLPRKFRIATLAHEAVHAINFIWKMIDETSIDEAYAHSVAAVVHGVMTGLEALDNVH